MIDPDMDPARAANERSEARAARHARRRALLAAGEPPQRRNVGHLVALPSAPPTANAGVLAETASVTVPAMDDAQTENAPAVFGSTTQLWVAAALVAVLLVAWFVERRSVRR